MIYIITKNGLSWVESARTKKELRAAKKKLSKVYGKRNIMVFKRVKELE